MMKLFVSGVAFGLVLFATVAVAQVRFNERFTIPGQAEWGKGVAVMDDSTYLVFGTTTDYSVGAGLKKFVLRKISQDGDLVWEKLYSDTSANYYQEISGSLNRSFDGGFFSSGSRSQHSDFVSNALLVKFYPNGDTAFFKVFNDSLDQVGYSSAQTTDSGFVLIGAIQIDSTDTDILLIKTDKDGNFLWKKMYGGPEYNWGYTVYEIPGTSELVVGGERRVAANYYQPLIFRLDSVGNIITQKALTSAAFGCGGGWIYPTSDSQFLMTACSDTVIAAGDYYHPRLVAKLDSDFNYVWKNVYHGYELIDIYIARQISDSGFVFVGFVGDSASGGDAFGWIAKMDQHGNKLWERRYKTALESDHYFADFQETWDRGFILSGSAWGNNAQDTWLVKLDSTGCLEEGCSINIGVIEVNTTEIELKLYPNPFTENLQFTATNVTTKSLLTVTNVLGQQVYRQAVSPVNNSIHQAVDLSSLANGVYFIRLAANDTHLIRKVIKE